MTTPSTLMPPAPPQEGGTSGATGGAALDRALAQLPAAMQALMDKAIGEADRRAEERVLAHLGDRHRRVELAIVLDGGGSVVSVGPKADIALPWSYEIEGWRLYSSIAGSIVVDLRVAASYHAFETGHASICAGVPPALTATVKNSSDALPMTDWTTRLTAGQILRPQVTSVTTVTLVTLSLLLRPV